MIRCLIAIILFACLRAGAASHYFDPLAVAGSNTGASWANAWTNDASITWASIDPGDTVYLSGGSTSKTYTQDVTIAESGTLTAIAGTASAVSNTVAVTGSGTAFSTALTVGQVLRLGKESRFVTSISSDTALTVDSVYRETHSGVTALRLNAITFRIGQDSGHNGIANFGTNIISRGVSSRFGIIIDGKRNTSATANPATWYQVREGSWTNNIGFWFHSRTEANSDQNQPNFAFFSGVADENIYRYIRISGYTNTTSGYGAAPGRENERGILFNGSFSGQVKTNMVWEFLKLDWNSGTQFGFSDTANTWHRGMVCRFSLIDRSGEDNFEVSSGWSMHDNVLGPFYSVDAHHDVFQFTGSYFEVFNNLIREAGHAYWRMQSTESKSPASPQVNHSIRIFNNIVSEVPGRSGWGGTYNEGMVFVHRTSSIDAGGYVTWSNILVANNTIYGSELSSVRVPAGEPAQMAGNPFIQWIKGRYVTNGYLKAIKIVNNLIVMRHRGNSFMFDTNTGTLTADGNWVDYEPFTTNEVVLNYNNFVGTNTSLITDPRLIAHRNVSGVIETHSFKFLNSSNWPAFVAPLTEDFELLPTDTAALNQGFDLSDHFSFDSLNRPRGSVWSRGAMESDSLVIHLNFEAHVDASDSITNLAGLGPTYNGLRFGFTNATPAGSNFPNRVSASSTPGTNGSTWAGQFDWYADGFGDYQRSGDYIGFTNMHRLTNMAAATIMFRGRYRPLHAGSNYTSDANAQFLSAGSAVNTNLGGWDFGRWNQAINANETRFFVSTNSNQSTPQVGSEGDRFFGKAGRLVCNFPDGYAPIVSDSTNWAHYAITFNAGTIVAYYNGSPIGTNDISGSISNLTLGARWLCVGCNTHTGQEPYLDDGASPTLLPNNGWLNGDMDDLKIADRAMSAAEICAESRNGNCTPAAAADASVGRVGKLRGIRL